MIELIKTYYGRGRSVEVRYAYRCKRCHRIWPDIKDRDAALFHDCKGPK